MSERRHETPRVALVTGAASGIGRAVVNRLVAAGMEVVGLDQTDGLDAMGGLLCDVTDEAAVSSAVDEVLRRQERIDALVNVAGITTSGTPVEDLDVEEWHRVLAVNLTGTFLCTKHVVPTMKRQGSGAIVNVASSSAARPSQAGQAAYVASKGGVVGLTRLLCLELAPSGVTVNAVSPGPTRTPRGLASVRTGRDRSRRRFPQGGWPNQRRWRMPWPTWSRPIRGTSTARSWPSTAA